MYDKEKEGQEQRMQTGEMNLILTALFTKFSHILRVIEDNSIAFIFF